MSDPPRRPSRAVSFLSGLLPRPDRVAARRAARTTAASLLAFATAAALGIDSPYWAAMTVWVAAQPTRGMLIGKCLSRLAGSVIGAAMAVALIHVETASQGAFVLALALWVAGCAGMANLLPGFGSYGAVVAGYTASLIALPTMAHPEAIMVHAVARVECTVIGILSSTLLAWLATPSGERRLLSERAERMAREAYGWIAATLRAGLAAQAEQSRLAARLVADMSLIDAQCDQGGSGSAEVRRERLLVRGLLASVLSAMAAAHAVALRRARSGQAEFADVPCIEAAGAELAQGPRPETLERAAALLGAAEARALPADATPSDLFVRTRMLALRDALQTAATDLRRLAAGSAPANGGGNLDRHLDWQGAARTAARVLIVLLAIGGAWLATGWTLFPPMMIGASVLCSIFSTFEKPKHSILLATLGTAAGTLAAVVCTLLLFPYADNLVALVLVLAPFMFVGGVALADRNTAMWGMDYSMVFLLVAAPALPMHVDRAHFLQFAPGPVLGAMVAALAFHFVLPVDPLRRLQDMSAAIARDLRALACAARPEQQLRWLAGALHRALRLVLRAAAAGRDTQMAVRIALASINVGSDLHALQDRLRAGRLDARHAAALDRMLAEFGAGRLHGPQLHERALDLVRTLEREGGDAPTQAALHGMADALFDAPPLVVGANLPPPRAAAR